MSFRLQALEFISQIQEHHRQGFKAYIKERGPMGGLLTGSRTQRCKPISYRLEPLKFIQEESTTIRSNIDPLTYLLDQKEKINVGQSFMLQGILQKQGEQVQAEVIQNQSFIKHIQVSKSKKFVSSLEPTKRTKSRIKYLDLSNYSSGQKVEKKDNKYESIDPNNYSDSKRLDNYEIVSTHRNIQSKSFAVSNLLETISVSSPCNLPRMNLVKRKNNLNNSLDFIDYSVDFIKPKSVFNVHITKTQSKSIQPQINQPYSYPVQEKKQVIKKKAKPIKNINETDNMFQRMISDINKQVKDEQTRNKKILLRPELTFQEIQGDFATENYQKMRQSLKKIQEYRGNLNKLSKRMEDIVNYRRYGEERDSYDDDLIKQGKLCLF